MPNGIPGPDDVTPQQFPPPYYGQPQVVRSGTDEVKVKAATWLFSQNKDTIALYLILGVLVIGGYVAITSWVPKHLAQIQSGYDKVTDQFTVVAKDIADKNRQAHKDIAESHAKDLDKTIQQFDKSIERMERTYAEGYRAAANKNVP